MLRLYDLLPLAAMALVIAVAASYFAGAFA